MKAKECEKKDILVSRLIDVLVELDELYCTIDEIIDELDKEDGNEQQR